MFESPRLGAVRLSLEEAEDLGSMLREPLAGACLVYLYPVFAIVSVV